MNTSEIKTLEPEQCLLMGPGPVNVYPSVLRAMSLPLLGQFDPQFTGYMNEVMSLYRRFTELATSGRSLLMALHVPALRPALVQ